MKKSRIEDPVGDVRFEEWSRERKLAAVVDSSVDPIVALTLDGTIVTWNRAAENLYGHTAEEAIGKHIRITVPEEGVADLETVLSAVCRGRRVSQIDAVRVDRHGRKVIVSESAAPIPDANGRVVGISLNARDVTARTANEEKYRLAVESSPNAIILVDSTGHICMVNAEAERLFGYGRTEFLGSPVDMLVPERFRSRHPGERARFMDHPEARAMGAGRDLYGLRKDGTEFPVEIGLRPIDTPEGTVVLSAIVDITGRKRSEEILARQARDLERSNTDLEQFAYVASHDLQEPLRTVASYTQLLERRYGDRLDPEARTYLEFARAGAVRMQNLIEALLAYSRVGTRAREGGPADCGAALDAALANLEASLHESGAHIERGELPTIAADPTQLAELFQNLIGNALKFHGKSPPRVKIAARRSASEWIISVADNGIGIAPEDFDRIFEVFQRLHGIDAFPGTGVGLAICKRIVDRLGGRIWVDSQPEHGSTFFFSAPAVDRPTMGSDPGRVEPRRPGE